MFVSETTRVPPHGNHAGAKEEDEYSSNIIPVIQGDLGFPMISCSIGAMYFDQALCDLGTSVSIMPKAVFDWLDLPDLVPMAIQVQLADSSVRCPVGIAEEVLVEIRGCFVPVDFVLLDMKVNKGALLILGRPFLSTTFA